MFDTSPNKSIFLQLSHAVAGLGRSFHFSAEAIDKIVVCIVEISVSFGIPEAALVAGVVRAITDGTDEFAYLNSYYIEDKPETDSADEEDHPKYFVAVSPLFLERVKLRELYGQGVDAGPLAIPSGADPPRR